MDYVAYIVFCGSHDSPLWIEVGLFLKEVREREVYQFPC